MTTDSMGSVTWNPAIITVFETVVCECCEATTPKHTAHLHPVEFVYICDECHRALRPVDSQPQSNVTPPGHTQG